MSTVLWQVPCQQDRKGTFFYRSTHIYATRGIGIICHLTMYLHDVELYENRNAMQLLVKASSMKCYENTFSISWTGQTNGHPVPCMHSVCLHCPVFHSRCIQLCTLLPLSLQVHSVCVHCSLYLSKHIQFVYVALCVSPGACILCTLFLHFSRCFLGRYFEIGCDCPFITYSSFIIILSCHPAVYNLTIEPI